jgi:SAM-dependent methyltransferase
MAENEWFRDIKYWGDNRSYIWSNERIKYTPKAAEHLVNLLDIRRNDKLLDLACGFGRFTFAFIEKGINASGVDLNPELIDEAIKTACNLGYAPQFICADMRDYCSEDNYDHIVILYNSFGYFKDVSDDSKVLRNCFKSLKTNGKILLSVMNSECLKKYRNSQKFRYWYIEDDTIRLEESFTNKEWTWNETKWILLHGVEKQEFSYGMRIYTKSQISHLLREAGFCKIQCYANMAGDPLSDDSINIVAVGLKEKD